MSSDSVLIVIYRLDLETKSRITANGCFRAISTFSFLSHLLCKAIDLLCFKSGIELVRFE